MTSFVRKTFALVSVLAIVAMLPAAANAKPICFYNDYNSNVLVLSKSKLKKRKAKPIEGYIWLSIGVAPITGSSVVSDSGTEFAIHTNIGLAQVTEFGGHIVAGGSGSSIYAIGFTAADGKLDIGDTGGGTITGAVSPATFTVIDCKTVDPIP